MTDLQERRTSPHGPAARDRLLQGEPNLGAVGLLYVQHRHAAQERAAVASMTVKLYEVASAAVTEQRGALDQLRAALQRLVRETYRELRG